MFDLNYFNNLNNFTMTEDQLRDTIYVKCMSVMFSKNKDKGKNKKFLSFIVNQTVIEII
jgi:hypothetical protein